MMSYAAFIRHVYPYPDCSTPSHRPALTQRQTVKRYRDHLIHNFASPGEPGESLSQEKTNLLNSLASPDSTYHLIVPSFFNSLIALQKAAKPFSLTLRSFGIDIPQAVDELNKFFDGQNPQFSLSEADISFWSKYKIEIQDDSTSPHIGTFYRTADVCKLIIGTLLQPDDVSCTMCREYMYDNVASVCSMCNNQHMSNLTIYTGYDEIIKAFEIIQQSNRTYAIRDYFPHWRDNNENASAGKLLFIDSNDSAVFPIFFDDNIRTNDLHILDVRHLHTHETIHTYTPDIHTVKVSPYHVMSNPLYFYEKILLCLSNKINKECKL